MVINGRNDNNDHGNSVIIAIRNDDMVGGNILVISHGRTSN